MTKVISVVTGGTGGHFFPALSVVSELIKTSDVTVCMFLDTRAFVKYKDIIPSQVNVYRIYSQGLQSKNILFLLKMCFLLFIGLLQSLVLLRKTSTSVVISFGGYSSVPVGLAARILNCCRSYSNKIYYVIHEQNSVLGKAHKIFVKIAEYVLLTFSDTKGTKNANGDIPAKFIKVGLPIREEFYKDYTDEKENSQKIKIVVLGGSLGANVFANNVPLAFSRLSKEEQEKLTVVHQCREELIEKTKNIWIQTKIDFIIEPFFHNIIDVIKDADMIISRSGASSVCEINALGKYALYVPFKKATENHQYFNALNAQENHFADIMLEDDFSVDGLYGFLKKILENNGYLEEKIKLSSKLKQKCNATHHIVYDYILPLAFNK